MSLLRDNAGSKREVLKGVQLVNRQGDKSMTGINDQKRAPHSGQIVYYHVSPHDDPDTKHNQAKLLPAIIVMVWSDEVVNLKVFTDGPNDTWKTSVLFDEEKPGHWSWLDA